jgi:hypothetical protein
MGIFVDFNASSFLVVKCIYCICKIIKLYSSCLVIGSSSVLAYDPKIGSDFFFAREVRITGILDFPMKQRSYV